MISNEEMIIFIKEFYLLLNEYQNCEDDDLKKQIKNDILFLSEIIEH